MKTNLLLLVFALLSLNIIGQEKTIQSKIKQVKVYTSNAEITREFSPTLVAGQQELVLSGISLHIDPASLQVKIDDNDDITLLSAKYELNYLNKKTKNSKIEALTKSIEDASIDLEWVRDQKAILKGMEDILNKNKDLGGDSGFTPAQVIELTNSYKAKLLEIRKEASSLQKQEKELSKRINKTQLQLNELQTETNKPDGNIVLSISAKHATKNSIKCSYIVNNAGWTPVYDLRSEGITKDVKLNYKANIYQNTGQDWNQVKIIVSSGNPSTNNNRPILNPLYAGFYNPNNYLINSLQGKITGVNSVNMAQMYGSSSPNMISGVVTDEVGTLPGANVFNRTMGIGTETDFDGKYSIMANMGDLIEYSFVGMDVERRNVNYFGQYNVDMKAGAALEEVVITALGTKKLWHRKNKKEKDAYSYNTQVSQNQINVEYEITHKQDITSDGKQNLVALTDYKLKTNYKYHVVPKLDKAAFLLAKISDWGQYNLLAGEANLFFEGAYVGKSYINPNVTSDTLLLSMGRDESISVQRKVLKNYTSSKFIGTNKKESFGYEISIKNKKNTGIEIEILDQIPVTQNKKIEITLDEKGQATYTKETGKLLWNYTLENGQSKKMKFGYTVKYPKKANVSGIK